MAKKSSIFTSLLLGAVGGAAAAVFLATETGKKAKKKVVDLANNYQENHEEINADLLHKAQDLGNQVVEKYSEVKEQLETGELTVNDLIQSGKEKAQALTEQVKEKWSEQAPEAGEVILEVEEEAPVAEPVVQDDIEITL